MSHRFFKKVAFVALLIGVGRLIHSHGDKPTGGPKDRRWGQHWREHHGPLFHKHMAFWCKEGTLQQDAETGATEAVA